MIPFKDDYSLRNDYYIMGITNAKTLGPDGGTLIYYLMKVEEIITFATAYERFPEWRADNSNNPSEKPIPIKPIDDNALTTHMESGKIYLIDRTNEIVQSFPFSGNNKSQKRIWDNIEKVSANMRVCVKVDSYDDDFIGKEIKLEAKRFIKKDNKTFSIVYECIPKAHHNAVTIGFKDLKKRKVSYLFESKGEPVNRRNGDRLFISYSTFKYFGKTLSPDSECCQPFEINKEMIDIFKSNISKYSNENYVKTVSCRRPRGIYPRGGRINPLIITGDDASRILELIAPEFN